MLLGELDPSMIKWLITSARGRPRLLESCRKRAFAPPTPVAAGDCGSGANSISLDLMDDGEFSRLPLQSIV